MKKKLFLALFASAMLVAGCSEAEISDDESIIEVNNASEQASTQETETSMETQEDTNATISDDTTVVDSDNGAESFITFNSFEETATYLSSNDVAGFYFCGDEFVEAEDYYEVEVILARPTYVPSDLEVGETFTIHATLSDMTVYEEEVTRVDEDTFTTEDGFEYFTFLSEECEEGLPIYCLSDDLVTDCFAKGILRVKKDATVNYPVASSVTEVQVENITANEYYNPFFDGYTLENGGYVTELYNYGD